MASNMVWPKKKDLFIGMQFFMRPCSSKGRSRKLIEENGGSFVNKMGKGVIRLTDNYGDTKGVHIDFVLNSIREGKLEDIQKYDVEKPSTSSNTVTVAKSSLENARKAYQHEEDEAIMQYVLSHKADFGEEGSIGGNMLWKEMERQQITCHSWQSMKDRYNRYLVHRTPTFYFQPLTIRSHGNTLIRYAKTKDSPLTDDSFHGSTSRDTGDECHDNTRRAEADGYGDNTKETGKRKQKKMYTAKNDRVFSDTPFKPTTKKKLDDQSTSDETAAGSSENDSSDATKDYCQQPQSPQSDNDNSNDDESQEPKKRRSSRLSSQIIASSGPREQPAAVHDDENQNDSPIMVKRKQSAKNKNRKSVRINSSLDESQESISPSTSRKRSSQESNQAVKDNLIDVASQGTTSQRTRSQHRQKNSDTRGSPEKNSPLSGHLLKPPKTTHQCTDKNLASTQQQEDGSERQSKDRENNGSSRTSQEHSEGTATKGLRSSIEEQSHAQQTHSAVKLSSKTALKITLDSDSSDQLTDDNQEHSQNTSIIAPRRKSARLNSLETQQQQLSQEDDRVGHRDDDAVSIIAESQGLFLSQERNVDHEPILIESQSQPAVNIEPIVIDSQSQNIDISEPIVIDSQSQPVAKEGEEEMLVDSQTDDPGSEEQDEDMQLDSQSVSASKDKKTNELNKTHNKENNGNNGDTYHSTNSQPIFEFSSGKSTDLFQSYTSEEASPRKTAENSNDVHQTQQQNSFREEREEEEYDEETSSQADSQRTNATTFLPQRKPKKKEKGVATNNKTNASNNNDTQQLVSPESNMKLRPKYSSTLLKNTSCTATLAENINHENSRDSQNNTHNNSDDNNGSNENNAIANNKRISPTKQYDNKRPPIAFHNSCSDDEEDDDEFDKALMRQAVNASPMAVALIGDVNTSSSERSKGKLYFDNLNPPSQCDCHKKKQTGSDITTAYAKYLERLSRLLVAAKHE